MSSPLPPSNPNVNPFASLDWQSRIPQLAWRAWLLLLLTLALLVGAVVYVLYARGVFEQAQKLVLKTDNSEGVTVGMDLSFAGFPIGRVLGVALAEGGDVRITIDVPRKEAHWLRESSVFTLERNLVGSTKLRAYTGIQTDPPLKDGAVRPLLRGDAAEEIPRLVNTARDILNNLHALTSAEGALAQTLANVQTTTARVNGPQGALGVLVGNEADARKLLVAVDRTQQVMVSADRLAQRLNSMAGAAQDQLLGDQGLVKDAKASAQQLQALLAEARQSLQKVDAVLTNVQATTQNVKDASQDLGTLRAEVESSLRRIDHLVDDISRRWPFGQTQPLSLP